MSKCTGGTTGTTWTKLCGQQKLPLKAKTKDKLIPGITKRCGYLLERCGYLDKKMWLFSRKMWLFSKRLASRVASPEDLIIFFLMT